MGFRKKCEEIKTKLHTKHVGKHEPVKSDYHHIIVSNSTYILEPNSQHKPPVTPAPSVIPKPCLDPTPFTVCAISNYDRMNSAECSFRVNDILEVSDNTCDLWYAKNWRTTESGFIPPNYVTKDDKLLKAWYNVDRTEAERKLLYPGVVLGTFLLRPSKEKGIPYILSVRIQGANVHHYRVNYNLNTQTYSFSSDCDFATLNECIAHYKNIPVETGVSLFEPRPRNIIPPPRLEECYIEYADIGMGEKIGQGNFGEVYKGFLRSVPVAVKKNLRETDDDSFRQEAETMHILCHPRLVKFLGFCIDAPDKRPLIITEFMEKGALKDYLRTDEGRCLEHNDLLYLVMQVAEGMKYLEDVGVIHRDLRAANVLVSKDGLAKVADFGLTEIYTYSEETLQPKQVPVRWTAPECILTDNQTRITEGASIKSDVWSFGVLMYEVFTYGELPYKDLTITEVPEFVKRGNILPSPSSQGFKCYDEAYRLMLDCWSWCADQRPSFEDVVRFVEDLLRAKIPNYTPIVSPFED